MLGYTDLRAAAVAFAEAAEHWRLAGEGGEECALQGGLHRYAADDLTLALPLLERAFSHANEQYGALARAVHLAARYRLGHSDLGDAMAGLALRLKRPDASQAGPDVVRMLQAEVVLRHGSPVEKRALLELALPPQASRWELHLLDSVLRRAAV